MHEADPFFLASLLLTVSFSFQIFLNYTVAGSSFVFGDMLVTSAFAFQVVSALWTGMRVTVGEV